mgnify:CR=1 FL=1
MSFSALLDLVYKAMLPEFTVFGFTINMFQVFVFSISSSIAVFIIREFMRW